MGFWGAVEETVVGGAAGAVGLVPGYGNVGAAAIHGVDAAAHLVAGDTGTAAREGLSAVGAAVPGLGEGLAVADLGQAAINAGVAVSNATGHEARTTGERINDTVAHGTNPINEDWGW
jgi:hypothetical protein